MSFSRRIIATALLSVALLFSLVSSVSAVSLTSADRVTVANGVVTVSSFTGSTFSNNAVDVAGTASIAVPAASLTSNAFTMEFQQFPNPSAETITAFGFSGIDCGGTPITLTASSGTCVGASTTCLVLSASDVTCTGSFTVTVDYDDGVPANADYNVYTVTLSSPTLSDITLSCGTISGSLTTSSVMSLTANVGSSTTTCTVSAYTFSSSSFSSLTVNTAVSLVSGTPGTYGAYTNSLSLSDGKDNYIFVKVIPVGTLPVLTYTIKAHRNALAQVSALACKNAFSTSFSPTTLTYAFSAAVGSTVSYLQIKSTFSTSVTVKAQIVYGGSISTESASLDWTGSNSNVYSIPSSTTFTTLTNGMPPNSGTATNGEIRVQVNTTDGGEYGYYKITFTKSALSNANYLTSMGCDSCTFSPSTWDSNVKVWTCTAANSITSSVCSFTLSASATAYVATASGSASDDSTLSALSYGSSVTATTRTLSLGDNYFAIKVIAQDGTSIRYYLFDAVRLNNDASLSSWSLADDSAASVTLSGTNSDTARTATVGASVTSVSLTLAPTAYSGLTIGYNWDTNYNYVSSSSVPAVSFSSVTTSASVVISGLTLTAGDNFLIVSVQSQDGSTTTYYLLTVTKSSGSDVATLSALVPSPGSLSFSSGTYSYSISLTYAQSSTSFTATTTDAGSFLYFTTSSTNVAGASATGYTDVSLSSQSGTVTVSATAGQTTYAYFKVVSESGSVTNYYIVSVARDAASTTATLSAITPSTGSVSGFSSSTYTYSMSVGADVSTLSMSATVTDSTSTLGFSTDGTTYSSLSLSASKGTTSAISLATGNNQFYFRVVAQDTTTSQVYQVTVTRAASTVNTLAGIVATGYQISPTFSSATTSYSLSLPNTGTASGISIKFTVSQSTETVQWGFGSSTDYSTVSPWTSVSYAGNLEGTFSTGALSVATYYVHFQVTAASGAIKYYVITMTRAAASSDKTLSSITLDNSLSLPSYSSATTEYQLSVVNSITSIQFTPVAGSSFATVQVKISSSLSEYNTPSSVSTWSDLSSGKATMTLSLGLNYIIFRVTAQSGDINYYKIAVTQQSNVALVNSVSLAYTDSSALSFSSPSSWNSAATSAFVVSSIPYAQKIVVATLTVSTSGSSVTYSFDSSIDISTINDGTYSSFSFSSLNYPTSTTITVPMQLNPLVGYLTIRVTSPDSTVSKFYQIQFTQVAPSTTKTLSALVPSVSSLDQAFASGTFSYSISLLYSQSLVSMTATLTDINSFLYWSTTTDSGMLTVGNLPSLTYTEIATASISDSTPSFSITAGTPYYIVLKVKPEDDSATEFNYYQITVNRAAASTDTTFSSLTSTSGTPTYNSFVYSLSVAASVSSVSFTATVNSLFSTLDYSASSSSGPWTSMTLTNKAATTSLVTLTAGVSKSIYLQVTAQSGASQVYTLTTLRAQSSDSKLLGLTVANNAGGSGIAISPTFSSTTSSYTSSVLYTVTSVNIAVTTSDSSATVAYQTSGTAGTPSVWTGATAITISSFQGSVSNIALDTPTSSPVVTYIFVRVTAADGTTSDYTVAVTRAAPDSDGYLSSLTTDVGTLQPTFAYNTLTGYTLAVDSSVTSVTFTPVKKSSTSSIYSHVLSGGESFASVEADSGLTWTALSGSTISVSVSSGSTTLFIIRPVAQDNSKQYYEITINAMKSIKTLSNLALNATDLSAYTFNSATLTYSLTVPYATNKLYAVATLTDTNSGTLFTATGQSPITYTGVTLSSGVSSSIEFTLSDFGATINYINFKVVAEDTALSQVYQLAVTRSNPASSTAITSISMSPTPTTSTTTTANSAYLVTYKLATSTATVTVATTDSTATVYYAFGLSTSSAAISSWTQGSSFSTQTLTPGLNYVDLKIVAQDGTTTSYAVITIRRYNVQSVQLIRPGMIALSNPSFQQVLDQTLTFSTLVVPIQVDSLGVSVVKGSGTPQYQVDYSLVGGSAASDWTNVPTTANPTAITLPSSDSDSKYVIIRVQDSTDNSVYEFQIRRFNALVAGDPQLYGFRGQSFQVHGIAGQWYNIMSYLNMQLNSLFVFRSKGYCGPPLGIGECWSHPGSYIGKAAFQLNLRSKQVLNVEVRSGDWNKGLTVLINDEVMPVSNEIKRISSFEEKRVVSKNRIELEEDEFDAAKYVEDVLFGKRSRLHKLKSKLAKHAHDESVHNGDGTVVRVDSLPTEQLHIHLGHVGVAEDEDCEEVMVAGSFPTLDAKMYGNGATMRRVCKHSAPGLLGAAAQMDDTAVPTRSGVVHIIHSDPRTVTIVTKDFTVKFINSDNFLNQELDFHHLPELIDLDQPSDLEEGVDNSDDALMQRGYKVPHGLIGSTWRKSTYKNQWKAIPGHVEDYVVSGAFQSDFLYNRFVPAGADYSAPVITPKHDHKHKHD